MGEENRRINKVIDIIENAYVSTAKGERNTQETADGQMFSMREQKDAVAQLNSVFNENLQKQIDGELESGFVYEMGMPSVYLQSTGIPALPMRLQASVLNKKSNDPNHLYDLAEIKDLVQLMQKPIAIFAYGDKGKAQNLMIGISQQNEGEGKQFLVGISINPTVKGKELQINSIRNVFPKNYHDWVHWINQGKLLRADGKEEIQGILNALRINPVDYVSEEDLDSAAKIVKDFDNPTISDENFAGDVEQPASFEEFLQSPGIQFAIRTPEERAAAENAYNFAQEQRPRKTKRYAVLNMDNESAMPEYYEKKELARKWRSYYNRGLKLGNYKLFDLDKTFDEQVNDLTGKFPESYRSGKKEESVERPMCDWDDSKEMFSLRAEKAKMVADAKANGTYMKAPNGNDTNLDEEQWVTVRTQNFKNWFGDWEKAARIAKLRESKPIVSTGKEYEGKYDLNNKSATDFINRELRGEYVNKDTNTPIKITRKGAFKVTRHDAENEAHLKSIALIPQMLENAIFIDEEINAKGKNGFDSYRYYVVGLKMDGVDYTVKLVVGTKNGETYYDHAMTEIEKTALINGRDEISSSFTNGEAVVSAGKDKRLFSILQTNSSKIVDENGEPMVVYHDTNSTVLVNRETGQVWDDLGWKEKMEWENRSDEEFDAAWEDQDFYTFDNKNHGRRSVEMPAFFFSPTYDEYHEYGDRNIAAFLNIKNPIKNPDIPNRGVTNTAGEDAMNEYIRQGYDGFIREYDGVVEEINAFYPNQIKSATDNNGEFSSENDDIRYSLRKQLTPDTPIRIVKGEKEHGFKNFEEAKAWAKAHIARTYNNEETGGKGDIRISNTAISKYLSQSAVGKSESKDVQLSVLKVLPDVIRESIDAELHPDRAKGSDNKRNANNGSNVDLKIHRLYGVVSIDGNLYRVKVTLKEDVRNENLAKKAYSYEATKIELLAGTLGKPNMDDAPSANNSISAAKVDNISETTKQSGEKFSLREDTFRQQLDEWKKKNGLPKDAEEPVIPVRNPGESAADFGKRLAKYRKEKALWNTAPTFEGHLVYGDEAQAEVNRALQRRSVLARIAYQDSMLPIRMTLDAIMKEHGLKGISPVYWAYFFQLTHT